MKDSSTSSYDFTFAQTMNILLLIRRKLFYIVWQK